MPRATRPEFITPAMDFDARHAEPGDDGLLFDDAVHRLEKTRRRAGSFAREENCFRIEQFGEIGDAETEDPPGLGKNRPNALIALIRRDAERFDRLLDRCGIAEIGCRREGRSLARDGIVRNIGLDTAAPATTAKCAIDRNGGVAELGRRTIHTAPQLAIHDDRHAEPLLDRDDKKILKMLAEAEPLLGETDKIGVVIHHHPKAGARFKNGAQGMLRSSRIGLQWIRPCL